MEIKSTDLSSLFEKALSSLETEEKKQDFDQTGYVIGVGDTHCKVHGLTGVVYGELVRFEGGNKGIVLDLAEDHVTVFLLDTHIPVSESEVVKRTGDVFRSPVGEGVVGRVINAVGSPIDGLGDLGEVELRPMEVAIPGIIERSPIDESLETGISAIDALVPIGKGQRELLIGNRSTGKTSIALDTILHQKGKNVRCIYVSIGQRQASLARIVRLLKENGALDYTAVVSADASESALNRYLAPYVATTLGEYWRDQNQDVLIVYDDLTNHAIAYREISLLMRRPPGREAYPGDVFYLHSRLLERSGKLAHSGSLTALPIVQVQGNDITAYIPTNLISITDGQIFLDTKLFNAGIRPAVNVELSVSRVGGAAQTKAMKQVTRALRLELAQYNELLSFAQFGTELDPISQRKLARGAIIVELLKQQEHNTYSFVEQVVRLFLFKEGFLDTRELSEVQEFARQFVSYVQSVYPEIFKSIENEQEMSKEVMQKLREYAQEFGKIFKPQS